MDNLYSEPVRELIGSFANIDDSDGNDFVERLDILSSLDVFRAYKDHTFRLMRPAPGSRLADIGCGTGEDARALSSLVGETGNVTGFDLSETMIAEARTRHGENNPRLSFVRAAADDLGCGSEIFDAVRADRVLLHVPDPHAALREAVRITKPGGRIVISEPDMGSLWCTTNCSETADAVHDRIARSIAHPSIARDLYHLFGDEGLVDVSVELRPLVYSDPDLGERILNFSDVTENLVETRALSEWAWLAFLDDLEDRKSTGRFLGGLTLFIVNGTKAA